MSFDDLTEAAFADGDALAAYTNGLADDFLRWIDEYGMDEQGWPTPEEFVGWIEGQCLEFMTKWPKWRANVRKEFLR